MFESSPTVTQLYAQAILQAAERHGITLPESILRQVLPHQRVPLDVQDQLWEAYCQRSDDPLSGLAIGLAIEIGHLDSAGMLLVTCDTLQEGLEALVEYAPVIGDGGEFSLTGTGQQLSLSYQPGYQVRSRERIEAVMASLVRLTRWATGHAFSAEGLWFAHAPLASPDDYRQRLDMAVHFEAGENSLRFDREQAKLPLIQANSALRDHLRKLADETLLSLEHQSLSAQVSRLVSQQPRWGKERVASELALSGRHLTRRLASEGVSFKLLREHELHRLAVTLLRSGHSIGDVADHLGFSEETALVRAFRRWEGETPARFRERHTRGDHPA